MNTKFIAQALSSYRARCHGWEVVRDIAVPELSAAGNRKILPKMSLDNSDCAEHAPEEATAFVCSAKQRKVISAFSIAWWLQGFSI